MRLLLTNVLHDQASRLAKETSNLLSEIGAEQTKSGSATLGEEKEEVSPYT